jgi:tetratricopeptide (TPR) repeat protein
MKNVNSSFGYLLIVVSGFVLLLLCGSCRRAQCTHPVIVKAEEVLFRNPDSALHLLQSIQHPQQLAPEDYAAWCLHYTHARYKLDIDISSDSMAVSTLNYYQKNYSPKYTGIAWYLYGISIEANHAQDAMIAYKKAYDCLAPTDEYDLLGLVCFSISCMYEVNNEYHNSLQYVYRALRYFEKSRNLKYIAYSYNSISDLYYKLGYPKEMALKYVDKTIHISLKSGDSLIYYYSLNNKAEMLYNIDCAESKRLFLLVFPHLSLSRATNASYLSYHYARLNKFDSTNYYIKIASQSRSKIDRTIYYELKAYILHKNGKYDSAFKAMEKAILINDSIYQVTNTQQLARLDKQYDLTQKIRENDRLKIANQWNTIVIFALLVLVLSGVVIFLIVRERMRKKQALLEVRNKELEIENRHKAYVNEQKRQALLVKLHAQIKNTLQFQRLQVGYHESKKHEEFLAAITRQSVIGTTEWDFYIREVNQLSDGRLQRLREEAQQLTAQDVIVICLICLGLDINRSCSLLNMTVNTMYQRRKRIKMRVGFKEDIELWAKTTIGDWDVEAADPDKLWVLDE